VSFSTVSTGASAYRYSIFRATAVSARTRLQAPGSSISEMPNCTKTDAGREITIAMQALKRMAKPDDIAPVVVFTASNDARWITGECIRVDGDSKL
jgi:3-oxoacyl-[acyl-carrier protein] reductase